MQHGLDVGQTNAEFGTQNAHDRGIACRRIQLEPRWSMLGEQPNSQLSRQITPARSHLEAAG
ncbi:hypothetical protein [Streptomyces xantholiticus]|uniref:hypothetical protein n=1 Tax=Streptomyces xantholiticus TaxID=68285 RepID=UPI0016744A09|nr:hypothetical protein [Streptomyces xantholiticus]